jgi:glycine C-acetyltransferase
MPDLFEKCHGDGGNFGFLRRAGDDYFCHPVLDPAPGHRMTWSGRRVIQWSINNYLGLAEEPELRAAAADAAARHGVGAPMGPRIMTGTTEAHLDLEDRFARWLGKESTVLFGSGYLGAMGTIAALLGPHDTVILDKLVHASSLDGILTSGARFRVFRHNDPGSLEAHLEVARRDGRGGILVVTEGVFGMRGDLGRLREICELKDAYGARLFVDDAHGMGVMGAHGRGCGEHWDLQDRIDVYFATTSKAFAAIGGVAAAARPVADWIRYNARTQVFTKAMPMIQVEVLARTLDLVAAGDDRRARMWKVARALRQGLEDLGFRLGDPGSPLVTVTVETGDVRLGMAMIRGLRERGVFVTGVAYPVVPRGIMLFRLVPTASHTEEDVAETLAAFWQVRDSLGLGGVSRPVA